MRKIWLAEFLGTAFLVAIVIGSGIMGTNLAHGNDAIALLANSIATGLGLFVLIQCLGPISGAHMNPVVSLMECLWKRIDRKYLLVYWLAQFSGAYLGIILVHGMFDLSLLQISTHERLGIHLFFSEIIATFGLICTIVLVGLKHVEYAPMTIAAYITSAYWFTSSTSFVNPAVTFARMFTDTFGGMAPNGFLPMVLAQLVGAFLAFFILRKNSATL